MKKINEFLQMLLALLFRTGQKERFTDEEVESDVAEAIKAVRAEKRRRQLNESDSPDLRL